MQAKKYQDLPIEAIAVIEAKEGKIERLTATIENWHLRWREQFDRAEAAESQLSTVRRDVLEEAHNGIQEEYAAAEQERAAHARAGDAVQEAFYQARLQSLKLALNVIAHLSLQSPVHAGEGHGPSTLAAADSTSPSVSPRGEPAPDTAESAIAVSALDRPRSRSNHDLGTSQAAEAGCGQSRVADISPGDVEKINSALKQLRRGSDENKESAAIIERIVRSVLFAAISPPPAKGVTEERVAEIIDPDAFPKGTVRAHEYPDLGSRREAARFKAAAVLRLIQEKGGV